jgi:ABC-type spermidine/putrescine transport system permease subunit II
MKLGFTNSLGTITALLAVVSGILASLGCAPGAIDFSATCNVPWLPEQWLPYAAMVTGAVAFVSKLFRPGGFLYSLFGGTAVVVPEASPKSVPGTVTPEQVASQ